MSSKKDVTRQNPLKLTKPLKIYIFSYVFSPILGTLLRRLQLVTFRHCFLPIGQL